jgi:hypothetical protein
MEFDKVLANLHSELRNLDLAIEALERLQNGNSARRRGRQAKQPDEKKMPRKAVSEVSGKKRE